MVAAAAAVSLPVGIRPARPQRARLATTAACEARCTKKRIGGLRKARVYSVSAMKYAEKPGPNAARRCGPLSPARTARARLCLSTCLCLRRLLSSTRVWLAWLGLAAWLAAVVVADFLDNLRVKS